MSKICSKCREQKLFTEFNKNKAQRDGYNNNCKICVKLYNSLNANKISERSREYYKINKQRLLDKQDSYRKYNIDKIVQYRKNTRKTTFKYNKKYREDNKLKFLVYSANRRAAKLNATPKWLTKEEHQQIEEFYQISQAFKLYTGQDYHVDHIVPLQGENVCGLHVPWNLQVLEASENIRKSNKF